VAYFKALPYSLTAWTGGTCIWIPGLISLEEWQTQTSEHSKIT